MLREQMANCKSLLAYIDSGFQKRLRAGQVNYWDCKKCLAGWFRADVWGSFNVFEPFGLVPGTGPATIIFGAIDDIHARRAALVEHIANLESQLPKFDAQEYVASLPKGDPDRGVLTVRDAA